LRKPNPKSNPIASALRDSPIRLLRKLLVKVLRNNDKLIIGAARLVKRAIDQMRATALQ